MQNLVVLDIIPNRDIILILGAIPGPEGSIVTIKTSVKFPNKKKEFTIITKTLKDEILKENEKLENKEALHEANVVAEEKAKKELEAEEAKKQAEAQARAKAAEVKKG
jgi:large subunit ribosomal protein L3